MRFPSRSGRRNPPRPTCLQWWRARTAPHPPPGNNTFSCSITNEVEGEERVSGSASRLTWLCRFQLDGGGVADGGRLWIQPRPDQDENPLGGYKTGQGWNLKPASDDPGDLKKGRVWWALQINSGPVFVQKCTQCDPSADVELTFLVTLSPPYWWPWPSWWPWAHLPGDLDLVFLLTLTSPSWWPWPHFPGDLELTFLATMPIMPLQDPLGSLFPNWLSGTSTIVYLWTKKTKNISEFHCPLADQHKNSGVSEELETYSKLRKTARSVSISMLSPTNVRFPPGTRVV